MAGKGPAPSVDELWLRSLQKVTGHVAHDFKGALNGVSVNLDVVRSRAERPGTPAADVQKFAGAATQQLGVVIRMSGALLSLGRPPRGSAEVSSIAKQVGSILEDTLRSDGARIEIEVAGGMSAETSAPTAAVRLILVEVMFAAASRKVDLSVRVSGFAAPLVEIRPAPSPELSREITAAVAAVGITVSTDGHGISIVFPGPAETPTEDA